MEKITKGKGSAYAGKTAWEMFSKTIEKRSPTKVFILTDGNTQTDCLPYFLKKVKTNNIETIAMPPGEAHKTIETCLQVWRELSKKGGDRNSLLVNLGGGVVTDLGGFVASTFMRGIPFINIPTTLLAMVDASIGGKNGVDLGDIKNQIGVVNLPEMVIVDMAFLKSLPQSHMVSGLAEMFKHGIIHGREYWEKVKMADFSR